MGNKIKVIVKRPDEEYGHMTWISDTLESLQRTVDGYIETGAVCEIAGKEVLIVCNEEGKLMGLEPNIMLNGDIICGTIFVCGTDGEDFADIPITFKEWKEALE